MAENFPLTACEREILIRALRIGFPSAPLPAVKLHERLVGLRPGPLLGPTSPRGNHCRHCGIYHDVRLPPEGDTHA